LNYAIKNIQAKKVLNKSNIPGYQYCLNPYIGCIHGCIYCYAAFMKRFAGHTEPWGRFVDIKINTPELLKRQLCNINYGRVLLSSVTDPYQPVEARAGIVRKSLEILKDSALEVSILTKSPLVLRDIDLLKKFRAVEVGFTLTTDNERIRKIFEPNASSIKTRIEALKRLANEGIRTYVFIGPLLPMNPEILAKQIVREVSYVLIDKMNYSYKTKRVYKALKLQHWLEEEFLQNIVNKLIELLNDKARILFDYKGLNSYTGHCPCKG